MFGIRVQMTTIHKRIIDLWIESHEERIPFNITSVKNFLDFIEKYEITNRPSIGMSNDGNICAKWRFNKKCRVVIEFRNYSYGYVAISKNNDSHGAFTIEEGLPELKEEVFQILLGIGAELTSSHYEDLDALKSFIKLLEDHKREIMERQL